MRKVILAESDGDTVIVETQILMGGQMKFGSMASALSVVRGKVLMD